MKYSPWTVKKTMEKIFDREMYLPAIQRKLVWETERIEKLFDSIMRGYPIGTFLFWSVRGNESENTMNRGAKSQYTFYEFIRHYHERDRFMNEVAQTELQDQFIGVLDGQQQRLNSMYVALQGTYAYKRKHGRVKDDTAFAERSMYINLFYQPDENDENRVAYQFRFLTKQESQIVDEGHYWFLVRNVLDWRKEMASVLLIINDACRTHPTYKTLFESHGLEVLSKLYERLWKDEVINYFLVDEQDLDKVVDIFVRVNSAGVQLSKTDLLFSTIVAHWNEGRSSIEETIKTLNAKGNRFAFDNDFIMRCCLVLTDLPVLFKVNSFRKENIERIKTNWPDIKQSLEAMVDLLVEWGFCSQTLPGLNALIPITYFIFKGGHVKNSKEALRQYLIRALVKGIFASKTDRVLSAIRDRLRVLSLDEQTFSLKNSRFVLEDLFGTELSKDWSLRVIDNDINEFLEEPIGAKTFMLLSLLYPHLKFDQVQWHQDHIHPRSHFSYPRLKDFGLSDKQIEWWCEAKDKLPNLQLMEGGENESKNDSAFDKWSLTLGEAKSHFMQNNYVPENVSLRFEDFEVFFKARKELLHQKLKVVFAV